MLDVPCETHVVGQEVALPPAALDFGGRSVVTVAGEFCTITRLDANTDIDAWARERHARLQRGEPRLLARPRGVAAAPFLADSRLLVRDASVPIQLKGPATIGDTVTGLQARSPGGFMASHERWLVESKVSSGSRSAHEHRVLSKALELAVSADGLNLANLSSMEYLNRRRQLLEEAHAKDPDKADFEGAHHFMGEDEVASGALAAPSLRAHVATEFAREAAIEKERRKAREAKKPGSKGAGSKD